MYRVPQFTGLMLNLTDSCNLCCKYCFVEQHPHFMTYQVAKDAFDLLEDINKDKNIDPMIVFFGGEPTLMWDSIIVPLVEYRNKKNSKIKFSMTSNCTLLNEERLKFMKDNGISLLFSIDGNKETQDFNRPCRNGKSSFDMLKPNIHLIVKYLPDTHFRGTIYPGTQKNFFDNIMFARECGFSGCYFMPDYWSKWTEEQIQDIKDGLRKYSLYFIDSYRNNILPIELTPMKTSIQNISLYNNVLKNNIEVIKKYPSCGLGIGMSSVNYEGKLYACQQTDSLGIVDNPYYIGDIYNGIDSTLHDELLYHYKNDPVQCINASRCVNCSIKSICKKESCHSTSYSMFKNMSTRSEIDCIWNELLFKEAVFVTNVLLTMDNQLFKEHYNIMLNASEVKTIKENIDE